MSKGHRGGEDISVRGTRIYGYEETRRDLVWRDLMESRMEDGIREGKWGGETTNIKDHLRCHTKTYYCRSFLNYTYI